jgi:hypothetical protein
MGTMEQSELATAPEAKSGLPGWLHYATVAVILAVAIAMNPGVRDGARRLQTAATAQLASEATHRINLTSPRSGEIALTEPVLHTIEMLRSNDIDSFRLSPAVGREPFVKQRLIEGAWPIRFDESSSFLVAYLAEGTGCAPVDRIYFDPGWRIPPRQAAFFAGRRGVQLARCP